MTRLIINADDFGLTPGVNQAIVELQQASALTSATLMANGPAVDDALELAQGAPGLGVGCHIVLVDGSPVAAGSPTLLTGAGFRTSLVRFAADLMRGRITEPDIEREAIAQIRKLQSAGVQVTHVDTHKHTHLFPAVARPVMRAAAACGVGAVRNPFEPSWSARLTRGALLRRVEVTLLRSFHRQFQRACSTYGMATTDGCIGVSATGQLNAASLQLLLGTMPSGTYELVCHPGYNDAELAAIHTRLRHSREIEMAALLNQIPVAVQTGRVSLASFREIVLSP